MGWRFTKYLSFLYVVLALGAFFAFWNHAQWVHPRLGDALAYLAKVDVEFNVSPLSTLKALFIWGGAWSAGRLVLRPLGLRTGSPLLLRSFEAGLGAIVFGYLFFFLGLLHLLSGPLLIAITALCWLFSAYELARTRPAWPRPPRPTFEVWAIGNYLGAVLLVGLLLLGYLVAWGPEVYYDALLYHIGLPKLHLLRGGMKPMPYHLYEGIPSLIQSFLGFGLALGSDDVTRLLGLGFTVLIASIFVGAFSKAKSSTAGIIAALVFFGTPLVQIKLGVTGNDMGLTVFFLLSARAAMYANGGETGSDSARFRWALLAGIFAGAAAGSKYTALSLLALIPAALLVLGQGGWPARLRTAVWSGVAATALVIPWVLKNWVFYGNPIFPIRAQGTIDPNYPPVDWLRLRSDAHGPDLQTAFSSASGFFHWITTFFRATWTDIAVLDAGFAGPLFVILILTPLFMALKTRSARTLALIFVGQWIFWTLTTQTLRHFTPGFALLALYAGLLALRLESLPSKLPTLGAQGLLIANLLLGLTFSLTLHIATGSILVGLKPSVRDNFLSQAHTSYPYPAYAAMQWVNASTPKDSTVLVVAEGRAFHLDRAHITSSPVNAAPLAYWANTAPSVNALGEKIRSMDIDYILVSAIEAQRIARRKLFSLTPDGQKRLYDFWYSQLELAFKTPEGRLQVWRVRPPEAPWRGPRPPQLPFPITEKK